MKARQTEDDDSESDCDDPEIVKLMMHYLHHLNYLANDDTPNHPVTGPCGLPPASDFDVRPKKGRKAKKRWSSPETTHLIEHAKLFAMASKYGIDAFQRLTVGKFRIEARRAWDHHDLVNAVHLIYTTTPDEVTQMRDVALGLLHKHGDKLIARDDIKSLLRSAPGLACELLVRNHGRHHVCCVGPIHDYREDPCFEYRNCVGCDEKIKACVTCITAGRRVFCPACAPIF